MKGIALAVLLACTLYAGAQQKQPSTLRSILLTELKNSHDKSDSFVCGNIALANLTPQQANWSDGKGNHSVGQLAYHLVYWNRRNLANLKGEKLEKFSGNNDETFDKFDAMKWNETVRQLDEVMNELEKWVEKGTAPDSIPAAHLTNGKPDRTRILCPYPQVATYKGTGDTNEAANFVCK